MDNIEQHREQMVVSTMAGLRSGDIRIVPHHIWRAQEQITGREHDLVESKNRSTSPISAGRESAQAYFPDEFEGIDPHTTYGDDYDDDTARAAEAELSVLAESLVRLRGQNPDQIVQISAINNCDPLCNIVKGGHCTFHKMETLRKIREQEDTRGEEKYILNVNAWVEFNAMVNEGEYDIDDLFDDCRDLEMFKEFRRRLEQGRIGIEWHQIETSKGLVNYPVMNIAVEDLLETGEEDIFRTYGLINPDTLSFKGRYIALRRQLEEVNWMRGPLVRFEGSHSDEVSGLSDLAELYDRREETNQEQTHKLLNIISYLLNKFYSLYNKSKVNDQYMPTGTKSYRPRVYLIDQKEAEAVKSGKYPSLDFDKLPEDYGEAEYCTTVVEINPNFRRRELEMAIPGSMRRDHTLIVPSFNNDLEILAFAVTNVLRILEWHIDEDIEDFEQEVAQVLRFASESFGFDVEGDHDYAITGPFSKRIMEMKGLV